MTDKETLIKILSAAGYEVKGDIWELGWDLGGDDAGRETIGVEDEDGSVGFSFNSDGSLKEVWGRDW